jgi:hypothetical protein
MSETTLLAIPNEVDAQIQNLIQKSHKSYMDVNKSVDRAKGVNRQLLPKRLDAAWLYETRYWDALTDEQRREVMWKEMARDISMFIWVEQTLPPLYMGYLNQYGAALQKPVQAYMMIFSKEEIVHTLMFRRYMDLAELEWFDPPEGLHQLFIERLPKMPPVIGVLATYLVELVAEQGAMYATALPGNEPLTREIARLHHTEEVRRIAFGRRLVEAFIEASPPETVARMRGFTEPFVAKLLANYTYNPELPRHLDFELGIPVDDPEKHREIRCSANNQRLHRERFGQLMAWMERYGLIGPGFQWLNQ